MRIDNVFIPSGCWVKRYYNGVCGKYLPREDTVTIRQNNVLHCRSLSSSVETATDQFSKINLPWTPGVIVANLHMSFCTVLIYESRDQQKHNYTHAMSNKTFKCIQKKTLKLV